MNGRGNETRADEGPVTFGGVAATRIRVIISRAMYVIGPAHAAGVVEVVIPNLDGRSASSPMRYCYVEIPEASGPWNNR